jgi:hypothetical protein
MLSRIMKSVDNISTVFESPFTAQVCLIYVLPIGMAHLPSGAVSEPSQPVIILAFRAAYPL